MINTQNESALHRALKTLYAGDGARCETELDGKIYDVVDKDGNVVEIQTRNVSKLLIKAMAALAKGRAVTIAHPVALEKTIELYDENGSLLSRRKSPLKGSVYSIFRELTGLYPVLLEPRFSLDVLEITMTERRVKTDEPVQSPNRKRRVNKAWLKVDKSLDKIVRTRTFKTADDYIALIPKTCLPRFSARDIASALRADATLPASAAKYANYMLWVLSRMGIIEAAKSKTENERRRYYRIATAK